MGAGMVRLGLESLLVVCDGLRQLALPRERSARVGVGVGMGRLDLQGAMVLFDGLGQLALPGQRNTEVDAGVNMVRLDLEGLLVVCDGLRKLALADERRTRVGVGVSMVWLHAQGRLVVLDRLRQFALPRERITPGVVGVNIARLEAQGRLVVLDRLRELAVPREREAQAKLTDGGSGIDGNGMAPKFLRVVPDASLVPGESSQAEEENNSEPGDQERSPAPSGEHAGTGQERPSKTCQVRVAVGGDLGAVLNDTQQCGAVDDMCTQG